MLQSQPSDDVQKNELKKILKKNKESTKKKLKKEKITESEAINKKNKSKSENNEMWDVKK